MMRTTILIFLFLLSKGAVNAQETATVSGLIKDEFGNALEGVHVICTGHQSGESTNKDGYYKVTVPANRLVVLEFTFLGLRKESVRYTLKPGENKTRNIRMVASVTTFNTVNVEDAHRTKPMKSLDPELVGFVPVPGDGVSMLLSREGAISRNELSSAYSVRGGNFDENLIYVNDIEIYRPFLVRAGQQEGLSFPNSDMIESIHFSAGGFEARYGDKLSSVLDITYKRPIDFAGSVRMSLLGGGISLEGAGPDKRFRHVTGIRYKANSYILNSLDTQGDYKPSFTDVQTYLTYDLTDQWEIAFLGNLSRNRFNFIPSTRETEFGTVNEALKLTVYFDGQEVDEFLTMTGAVSANHVSHDERTLLKFIGSAFKTFEDETFDILGQYWLDELERDLGSDNFGEVASNRGVGTFLNHARNHLEALVTNFSHKGFHYYGNQYLLWGMKVQHEHIVDQLSEWNMIDSAGFSLPQAPSNAILLQDVAKADINLSSNRITAYVQNNWNWKLKKQIYNSDTAELDLSFGVRGHFWDYNRQFVFSPRANLAYTPLWFKKTIQTDSTGTDTTHIRRDYVFRLSTGFYHQPPFYRELRDFQGNLNPQIQAQKSVHAVLGIDRQFRLWGRSFKWVTEFYYKHMWDLIPYELDNVRIRYFATNNSRGYTYGGDTKINGEFIKGVESWATLSLMKSEEDLSDDFYYDYFNEKGEKIISGFSTDQTVVDSVRYEPGFIPGNQDQRIAFSLFFQDEMPRWPSYKVHLNLLFASGLPFGPPTHERYKDILRTPSYRRVDIGFSKTLINKNTRFRNSESKLRHIKDAWVSLEVFNLFGVPNVTSYLWIKDVTNRQYAIPNFLTARRLNVKFAVKF